MNRPTWNSVLAAVDLGFNLVMFSDEEMKPPELSRPGERGVPEGPSGRRGGGSRTGLAPRHGRPTAERPADLRVTDPDEARRFVAETGVDALAVNVGQLHLHGRQKVRLDLDRLSQLRAAVDVPLVLHGASSVEPADLAEAVRRGIRKINVASVLKQTYFQALAAACRHTEPDANPYEIIGSGLPEDVLRPAASRCRKRSRS